MHMVRTRLSNFVPSIVKSQKKKKNLVLAIICTTIIIQNLTRIQINYLITKVNIQYLSNACMGQQHIENKLLMRVFYLIWPASSKAASRSARHTFGQYCWGLVHLAKKKF